MIDRQRVHDEAYRWEVVVTLMQDHGDAITRYCLTWLGQGLAEEMAQEVFLAAWQQLPRYQPEASLRTWLFGIARHKCQQAYRNRARRQAIARTFSEEIGTHVHAAASTLHEDDPQAVGRARLHHCLSQLRSDERILLTLRYWKQLPVAEIADIVGKGVEATRKQLHRLQQRLRECMQHVPET